MRKSGVVYFLTQDHLGGTSLITQAGDPPKLVSRVRYNPYGTIRTQEGTALPTDKLFTGQQRETTAIYNYGARFYNADLARFLSADSIVPSVGDPQLLNRYAYVANNPLKYTDPTGNVLIGEGASRCGPYGHCSLTRPDGWWMQAQAEYNFGLAMYQSCSQLSNLCPVTDYTGGGNVARVLLDVGEFVPFLGIGDAISAARLIESCVSGTCDYWRAVDVVPLVPGGTSRVMRTALKFSDEAADAARAARLGIETVDDVPSSWRDQERFYEALAKANAKFPHLADENQAHHVIAKRLNMGTPTGPTVQVPWSYHILITNETERIRKAIGPGPYNDEQIQAILSEVYTKYPLPEH